MLGEKRQKDTLERTVWGGPFIQAASVTACKAGQGGSLLEERRLKEAQEERTIWGGPAVRDNRRHVTGGEGRAQVKRVAPAPYLSPAPCHHVRGGLRWHP